MAGEEPPFLSVGTDVSAKYKGAFCEAKIKKVIRSVKCKLTFKNNVGTAIITDDLVKGVLRVGAHVEAKHPEKNQFLEAVINKLHDYSQYTVVFDDGDETTLRRTSLCLKSGRHFAESETLDQLPLTHPEHFGTPVIGTKGRKRRSLNRSALTEDSSDEEMVVVKKKARKPKEVNVDLGKVLCVELSDRKKQKDNWYPGVVVSPAAHPMKVPTKDEFLVRSFKDGKYYIAIKKDTKEFTKEIGAKVENNTLKTAVDKALVYLDRDELPAHWDRELLFGAASSSEDTEQDSDSDTSDDEPSEEKDHFVAKLYKHMDDRGTPINKAPAVSNKDLNLYKLYKVVEKMNGYNRVTNQMQWKAVYNKMGLPTYSSTSSHQIKQAYKKYLHSFEDFNRKLGCTMGTSTRSGRVRTMSGRGVMVPRERDREFKAAGRRLHKHAIKVVSDPKKSKEVEVKKEEEEVDDDDDEEESTREEEKEKAKKEKPADPPKLAKKPEETSGTSSEDAPKTKTVIRDGNGPGGSGGSEEKRGKAVANKQEDKKVIAPDSSEDESADDKEETRSRSRGKGELGKGDDSLTKRRGRKRGAKKEGGEDGDKSLDSDDDAGQEIPILMGDRVKVKYGRGRQEKIYEAKVLKLDKEEGTSEPIFFVHYTGWNMRYDEWVKKHRIVENVTRRTLSKRTRTSLASRGSRGASKRGRPHGKSQDVGPPPGSRMTPSGSKIRATRSDRNSLADSPFANGLEPRRRTRRSSGPGGAASSSDEECDGGSGSDSDDDERRAGSCDSPPADKKASSPEDLNTSLEDMDEEDASSVEEEDPKVTPVRGSKVERKSSRAERGPPPKGGRTITPKGDSGRTPTPKSDASKSKVDTARASTSKTEKQSEVIAAKGARAKLTRSLSKELAVKEEAESDGSESEDELKQGSPRVAKTRGRPPATAKASPAKGKEQTKAKGKKAKTKKPVADSEEENVDSDAATEEITPASSKKASGSAPVTDTKSAGKSSETKEVAKPLGKTEVPRAVRDDSKKRSEPFSNLEKQVGIEVRVDTVARAGLAEDEDEEEPPLSTLVGLSRRGASAKAKNSSAESAEPSKSEAGTLALGRQAATNTNILEMDDEMKRISSSLMSSMDAAHQAGVLDNSAIFGTPVDEVEAFAADYCPVMDSSCDSIEMDNIFPPGLMDSVKAVATPEGDGAFTPAGQQSPRVVSERREEVERDLTRPKELATPTTETVVANRSVDVLSVEVGKAETVSDAAKTKLADDRPVLDKDNPKLGKSDSKCEERSSTPTDASLKSDQEEPNVGKDSNVNVSKLGKDGSKHDNLEFLPGKALKKLDTVEVHLERADPKLDKSKSSPIKVASVVDTGDIKLQEVRPPVAVVEQTIAKPESKVAVAEPSINILESKPSESAPKTESKIETDKIVLLPNKSVSSEVKQSLSRKDESPAKKDKPLTAKEKSKIRKDELLAMAKEAAKVGKDDSKVLKEESEMVKDESRLVVDESDAEKANTKSGKNVGKDDVQSSKQDSKSIIDKFLGPKDEPKGGKPDSKIETDGLSKVIKDDANTRKDETELRKEEPTPNPVEQSTEKFETKIAVVAANIVTETVSMSKMEPTRFSNDTVNSKETPATKEAHKSGVKAAIEEVGVVTKESSKEPAGLKKNETSHDAMESTAEVESTPSKSGNRKEERRKQRTRKPDKRKAVSAPAADDDDSTDDNHAGESARLDEPKAKKRKSREVERDGSKGSKQRSREKRSKSKKGDGAESSSKKRKGRRRDCKRKRGEGTSHRNLQERDGAGGESDPDASTASSDAGPTVRSKRRSKKRKGEQDRKRGGKKGGSKTAEQPLPPSTTSDESGGHAETKRSAREKGTKSKKKRDKERAKEAAAIVTPSKREALSSDDAVEATSSSPPLKTSAEQSAALPTITQAQQQQDSWMMFVGGAASKEKIDLSKTDTANKTASSSPWVEPPSAREQRRDISSYLICEENVPASPVAADSGSQLGPDDDDDVGSSADDGGEPLDIDPLSRPVTAATVEPSLTTLPTPPFVPLTMRHKIGGVETAKSAMTPEKSTMTITENAARALLAAAASSEKAAHRREWENTHRFSALSRSSVDRTSLARSSAVPVQEGNMEHMDRVQRLLDRCSQGDRDLLDLAGLETRRGLGGGGGSGEGLLEGLAAVAGAKREQAASAASLEDSAAPSRRRRRNLRKHHHQLPAGCDSSNRHGGSSSSVMYGRHRHGSAKNRKGSDTEDATPTSQHQMVGTSSPPSHQASTTMSRSILDQHLLQQSSPRPSRFNFYVELDDYSDGAERIAILQEKLTELRKAYLALKAEVAGIDRRRKKLKRKEKEGWPLLLPMAPI